MKRQNTLRLVIIAVASTAAVGCNGQADMSLELAADHRLAGEEVEGGFGEEPVRIVVDAPRGLCSAPQPARIWRLTHPQYDATVESLFASSASLLNITAPQSAGSGFTNGSETAYVNESLANEYQTHAEQTAAATVASLSSLLPCSPASATNTTCVQKFIEQFGERAFRKPLTTEQKSAYFELYTTVSRIPASSATLAVQAVLEAMLQSPHFLYRFELGRDGAPGSEVNLTDYELASQMSYLLWNAPPDTALMDKARAGGLGETAAVTAEMERMLQDPRARALMPKFMVEYLGADAVERADKDAEAFPEFDAELAADLHRETEAFVEHVVWDGSGTLNELLTADYSFLNQRLATHYGVSGVSGSALRKAQLPPSQRSGILTHGSVLASYAHSDSGSPVQRGLLVRRQLFCQFIPDPPPSVVDTVEPASNIRTTRERYAAHSLNAACSSCHNRIDPIGFGFENYDGVGKFRTTEAGVNVDASGEIFSTLLTNGKFNGALELNRKLADSAEVSDCVVTHFWRYAMGRVETQEDRCAVAELQEQFRSAGGRMNQLVRVLADSDAFHRRVK